MKIVFFILAVFYLSACQSNMQAKKRAMQQPCYISNYTDEDDSSSCSKYSENETLDDIKPYKFKINQGLMLASYHNLKNHVVSCKIYSYKDQSIIQDMLIVDKFSWSKWFVVDSDYLNQECRPASLADLMDTMALEESI